MRENYTLSRLYFDTLLNEGVTLILPKEQAHYLGNVLRKRKGDEVRLFNGQDGEWRAEIANMSKKATEVVVKEQLRVSGPCPDITLCFALVRKHRCLLYTSDAADE